jgi:hypothetical protein
MGLLDEHGDELAQLGVYGVGIALYTLAVAVLYVPMGTRMMFARRFGERRIATPGRRFMFVLFFPLVSFLFFLVIAASMIFMAGFSDDDLTPIEAMTLSMAIVLAIRICAYFSEHAASDLAKVMPLSMLAVVLVSNGFGDLRESVANLQAFGEEPALLGAFFLVVVAVEFLLRVLYEALGRPNKGRDPRDPVPGLQKRPG